MKRSRGGILSPRLIAAASLAVSIGLLLIPTSALAQSHSLREAFGSANEPSFVNAEGLAVDQSTGDLLVIDAGAGTVSRWNPDGTPSEFSALGANAIEGLSFGSAGEVQIAVDNSGGPNDGNIYVPQASAGLVDVFGEDGSLLGQLTESSEGALSEPCGVAVDPSGSLYVGDFSGHIHKYEPAASPPVNGDSSDNFAFENDCTLAAGAAATNGFIFPAHFSASVAKLDSASGAEEYVAAPGSNTTETVNPASGSLLTATGAEVKEYDASGATEATLLSSFSSGGAVNGIAVDGATGDVYVARAGNPKIEVWAAVTLPDVTTGEATEVTSESATLNGAVNPNGLPLTECLFEYGETEAYGETAPCEDPDATEVGEGNSPVPVHADVAGLNPGTIYHFRLVAANASGSVPGDDKTLQTLGPAIRNESASQITATGARIGGEINPNGEEASFFVQYVTEAQFLESGYAEASEAPAIPRELGEGTAFLAVIQQLSGLAPQTTYHFRLVAITPAATSRGPDMQFSTFALPGEGLPDGRAYEMVSPPQKLGEVIPPEPLSNLGGSCGECLPAPNKPTMPMQAAPDGESALYEGQPFSGGLAAGPNEYIAGRGAGEWGSQSLSEPTTTGRYEAFSADLSRGVLSQEQPPLSPEAPSREGRAFANLYLRDGAGPFRPLVTAEPPHREPGTFKTVFAGANAGAPSTPAFSHLLLEANDALTAEVAGIAPEAPEVEAGGATSRCEDCNLYEWVGGQLRLINVLPGNAEAASHAVIGSGRLLADLLSLEAPNVDHAISDDGRRIFWSSEESGQVYARIDGAETLEIPGSGSFLTASADGSQVLLSNGQIFELNEEAEPQAYEPVADLSEGEGGFTGILGASEDLSRVYFIDTAALTEAGEENANGEAAEAGKLNLYAWDEGETAFIGALRQIDNRLGQGARYGTWKAARPDRLAQVSADGRHLAFMSQAPLSGSDNRLASGGECTAGAGPSCFEVFTYAAEPKTLTCASCNPSGQRPIGPSNLSLLRPDAPFPQPGNLTAAGSGRLFFESQDALSPRDTNGSVQDVYEWEPDEVGSCEKAGGCVFLISSGHSPNDSMFLDSTPSGADAFFITREQLLTRDKDQQLDLYDARIGGGPEESATAPCGGEACKGPIATPPPSPSAGSQEFSGPGNPPAPKPACKPGFTRKGGKCVKKHHKKHHNQAAKRNRGGSFSRRK